MANEEIIVHFGGNLGPLQAALRGLKHMMSGAAESIKESFKDAFHHLSAPLSVAGAFEAIKSVVEEVKNIKRISESTGLDTGITQDMLNLGKASGIAGDAIESAMDKFVKNLAPGSDPEQALYNLADKMSKIEDPTERARLAVANFGKTGVKLIPILAEGAEGIKRMSEEWGKLSDAEIEALEHANQVLEKQESHFKVGLVRLGDWIAEYAKKASIIGGSITAGRGISIGLKGIKESDEKEVEAEMAIDNAKEAQKTENAKKAIQDRKELALKSARELADKEAYVSATPAEKVLMLTRQILEAKREIEDLGEDGSDKTREKLVTKIAELEEKRQGIIKATDREHKEALQKELAMSQEIDKAKTAVANAEAARARERMAEFLPTLQELAGSGYAYRGGNKWNWQQGPFAQMAQEELNLKRRVKNELMWGNKEGADRDISRIDELKKALSDAGVQAPDEKLESINKTLASSDKHLQNLLEKATGEGINVKGEDD